MYPSISLLCKNCGLNSRIFSLLRCTVYRRSVFNVGTCQIRNASSKESVRTDFKNGPSLQDFIKSAITSDGNCNSVTLDTSPYLTPADWQGLNRKVYFEIYGCQMNVNDIEVVWSILKSVGFQRTETVSDADVILIMTCSIRESAETKVWNKLFHFRHMKLRRKKQLKIGILGEKTEVDEGEKLKLEEKKRVKVN